MLIWELCYQKIPYEKLDFAEIQEHVKSKRREDLSIQFYPNTIAQEFAKIIKQGNNKIHYHEKWVYLRRLRYFIFFFG